MKREQVYDLVEQHYRDRRNSIVKRIRRFFQSPHYSEDVVQEAYTRALKYWNTYDPEQNFNTWFSAILNNAIKDFFKTEALQGMVVDVPGQRDDGVTRIFDRLALEELVEYIEKQPDRISRILHLNLIQGYTSDEVAQLVPETADNIRKIVQRFREDVRGSALA
jgi:RNA polymerase sigma factor (sigma-70 family)